METNKFSVSVYWSDTEKCFAALSPEFPLLSAFADTKEEALSEAEVVIKLMLEDLDSEGESQPDIRPLLDYSGNVRLRLPKTLHQYLAHTATYEGVSLNSLIMNVLSQWRGAHEYDGVCKKELASYKMSLTNINMISVRRLLGGMKLEIPAQEAFSKPEKRFALSTSETKPLVVKKVELCHARN
ncbi:MAG: toxin-antitoxin system HicB family antitoxin [Pseudomonadota bacterium]